MYFSETLMTPQQITLVQQSFAQVKPIAATVAEQDWSQHPLVRAHCSELSASEIVGATCDADKSAASWADQDCRERTPTLSAMIDSMPSCE